MINLTCIQCPRGCSLIVEKHAHGYEVTGNFCPKGKEYALSEVTHPTRVITTTIKMGNERLPVKTDKPVDKNRIFEIMDTIKNTKITMQNVRIGDIIKADIDGNGCNLVAAANK